MAKGVQNINRLKCWPDLAAAGFALESFRGPDMRVNCVGAKGPAGVLIYKNEESDVRPWVVSLSGENEESTTVASGRELLPLLRRVRPALFAGPVMYTKDDLEAAYNAGAESVHYEWHLAEFHTGENCKCGGRELYYENFSEWIAGY